MIRYAALIRDLALQNKNLTTPPEFMSDMFTALIYIYTWKFHMINVKKKRKEFGTYVNSSKRPCNLTQHC